MPIDGRGCHKAEASIALAKANEELSRKMVIIERSCIRGLANIKSHDAERK